MHPSDPLPSELAELVERLWTRYNRCWDRLESAKHHKFQKGQEELRAIISEAESLLDRAQRESVSVATQLRAHLSIYYTKLGACYWRRRDFVKALPAFERAMRLDPDDAHMAENHILLLIDAGDYRGAAASVASMVDREAHSFEQGFPAAKLLGHILAIRQLAKEVDAAVLWRLVQQVSGNPELIRATVHACEYATRDVAEGSPASKHAPEKGT